MADLNSGLPIRTENAGDADVFISDSTTPSQKLKVNANGSIDTNPAVGAKIIITDGTDDLEINADGSINSVVTATDLDIRNLSELTDNVKAFLNDATGAAFSAVNPLPVSLSSDQAGDEVIDYQTSAAVAAAASVSHDYTVTLLKTFIGQEIFASASGKLKVEVQVNAVTQFVGFNSTSNPNVSIPLDRMMKGAAGQVISIILTNRDKQPQDLYSTLSGLEV